MTPNREQLTIPPDGRKHSEQPRWRQDFPIDWPQDQYVSRRDFTKFMVLTSFAFVVGQLWIGLQSLFKSRIKPAGQPIMALANLPVGGAKAFNYPGPHDTCLLVRLDEKTVVAFDQKCTHLSCAVIPQPEKNRFLCPCHEGSFDIATGRPISGPPQRPLPRITLEVRNGAIYATGVEEPLA